MARTDELLFPGMTADAIDARLRRLRVQNVVMGVLHLVQAVAVYVLNETDFELPIAGTYPQGPPGTPPVLIELFSLDVGFWVFAFLAISALAHFTIASPWYFARYSEDIRRGIEEEEAVAQSIADAIVSAGHTLIVPSPDYAAGRAMADIEVVRQFATSDELGRDRFANYWNDTETRLREFLTA